MTEPFFIVTGAANGIGRSISMELASYGKSLLLIDLDGEKLRSTTKEIQSEYPETFVHAFTGDLIEKNTIPALWKYVKDNQLRIQGLINNAGIGCLQKFITLNSSEVHNILLLNNMALTELTHTFLPELRKFNESFILNVGSILSHIAVPNKSVYCASKSFVLAFSKSLYHEEKPYGVHVSCLCPGATITSKRCEDIRNETNFNSTLFTQTPQQVAGIAIRNLFQRKFLIVPGAHNKFIMFLISALPESIKRWLILQIFARKRVNRQNPYLSIFTRLPMLVRD